MLFLVWTLVRINYNSIYLHRIPHYRCQRDIIKKRFFEMAPVTLGIAALTFFIGFLVKTFLHLEVYTSSILRHGKAA